MIERQQPKRSTAPDCHKHHPPAVDNNTADVLSSYQVIETVYYRWFIIPAFSPNTCSLFPQRPDYTNRRCFLRRSVSYFI